MKSQGFLAKERIDVVERVDAGKGKLGRAAALTLARGAARVVAMRRGHVMTFDMRKTPPDDETLAKAILGPTGNLRAPAIRRGDTLFVGFDEATYRAAL